MIVTAEGFQPSEESLGLLQACSQDLAPEKPDMLDWHQKYISGHTTRLAFDLDMVTKRVPAGAKILECGSAPYLLTLGLARSDYEVVGCDLSPERYKSTIEAQQLEVIRCDFETESFPVAESSFDLVIFNEVFEHLRINPIFSLTNVLSILKPGGMLMLSSPNLKSIDGIRRFIFEGKAYSCCADIYDEYSKLESLGHMGHVREYTTVEVCEFLGKLGFKVEEIVYRGRYGTSLKQAVIRTFPQFRPFVSYVARKPGNSSA